MELETLRKFTETKFSEIFSTAKNLVTLPGSFSAINSQVFCELYVDFSVPHLSHFI